MSEDYFRSHFLEIFDNPYAKYLNLNMKKLENKIVFIAGGNSGIGKASVLEAAREGITVVIADLENKDHEQTIDEITALGANCIFVPIDVSDVESVKKAINTTVEKFGYCF